MRLRASDGRTFDVDDGTACKQSEVLAGVADSETDTANLDVPVNSDVLEVIADFCRTGARDVYDFTATLHARDVGRVLVAADYLCMRSLQRQAVDALLEHMRGVSPAEVASLLDEGRTASAIVAT